MSRKSVTNGRLRTSRQYWFKSALCSIAWSHKLKIDLTAGGMLGTQTEEDKFGTADRLGSGSVRLAGDRVSLPEKGCVPAANTLS